MVDPYFFKLDTGQTVEDVKSVYFVAIMSSNLPIGKEYIGIAGDYFENRDYVIQSSESIFLETSVILAPGSQKIGRSVSPKSRSTKAWRRRH